MKERKHHSPTKDVCDVSKGNSWQEQNDSMNARMIA
jgi:hypothetical protein